MIASSLVPVAITDRSGLDECVHHGMVLADGEHHAVMHAVGASAEDALVLGGVDDVLYPRSSNKPMQAVAMVRAGLRLPPHLLALVCASHNGTPMHLDAAAQILAASGLSPADLANTPDYPLDDGEQRRIVRSGGGPTSLQQNCSGKHSGMLATCVVNGWAHDAGYLDPEHPLQRRITAVMHELIGGETAHVGVDGCGAPAHAMTLRQLVHGVRAVATGAAGDAGNQVARAMTAHPEMVGGDTADVTLLMRHVPGLVAKDGAEGVFVAAMPDGRAAAVKIGDGASRARPVVMLAALAAVGIDVGELPVLLERPVRGHGHTVGRVRAAW